MITALTKYHHLCRTLLLLSVALGTMLTLLLSALAFPGAGFAPISLAHAQEAGKAAIQAQTQSRCLSQPNAQNCTDQDPVVQGCNADAQTLAFKDFLDAQGVPFAVLERRYSPACHSEWGRMTDERKEPLQISIGTSIRSTTGTVVAYSPMIFVPNLSIAPLTIGSFNDNGIDFTHGGGSGGTAILPAFPPVQKP